MTKRSHSVNELSAYLHSLVVHHSGPAVGVSFHFLSFLSYIFPFLRSAGAPLFSCPCMHGCLCVRLLALSTNTSTKRVHDSKEVACQIIGERPIHSSWVETGNQC